jgi:hypothetical protein
VLLQEFQGQANQVVKVHALVGGQAFFIPRHDACGDAFVVVAGLRLGHGSVQALVFPQADGPLPLPSRGCIGGAPCIFQDGGHIIGVQDAEVFLQSQRFTVLPQHAHTQSVKSANHHFLCVSTHQFLGAFAHFSSGFVGESDGGNALGFQPQLDQVANFVGDDAGFARTRTGQHKTRALHMVDRFELGEIQVR